MKRSIYLLSYSLAVFLSACNLPDSHAQIVPFYKVTPFEEEEYFSKTVFSFNPDFIKGAKVKGIALRNSAVRGKSYHYTFNRDGLVESITTIRRNQEKTDTSFYRRYYYNSAGSVTQKAVIDYNDGVVKISSYGYDEKNRVGLIRTFVLNSGMPDRPQANDWYGTPAPGADKIILQGGPPDEALLSKLAGENNFSSWHYRYYTQDGFEAEERTELDDSRKLDGKTDTCARRLTYYYQQGKPVSRFIHEDCSDRKSPSEVYKYQQGLLLENANMPDALHPRKEKYTYDSHKNLLLMEDIWAGKKVSELLMTYDKNGFLRSIQRKSLTAEATDYFEDRVFTPEYTFYP